MIITLNSIMTIGIVLFLFWFFMYPIVECAIAKRLKMGKLIKVRVFKSTIPKMEVTINMAEKYHKT